MLSFRGKRTQNHLPGFFGSSGTEILLPTVSPFPDLLYQQHGAREYFLPDKEMRTYGHTKMTPGQKYN